MRRHHDSTKGFFNFISYNFGHHTTYTLKDWIKLNHRLIKTINKIWFLKRCVKDNIFPPHILHAINNCFYISNYNSRCKFNTLSISFMHKLVRIKIDDAFCDQRFLRRLISSKTYTLYKSLPSNIWKDFFDIQLSNFHKSYMSQSRRLSKKLDWLLYKRQSILITKTAPISYFWSEQPPITPNRHNMSLRS